MARCPVRRLRKDLNSLPAGERQDICSDLIAFFCCMSCIVAMCEPQHPDMACGREALCCAPALVMVSCELRRECLDRDGRHVDIWQTGT